MENIIEKLCAVGDEIGAVGKVSVKGLNYKIRSIDDLINKVSPLMRAHKILVGYRILKEEITNELTGKEGKVAMTATVTLQATFYWKDQSYTTEASGHIMNYGDKALQAAQSIAKRIILCDTFNIPFDDSDDFAEQPAAVDTFQRTMQAEITPQARAEMVAVLQANKAKFTEDEYAKAVNFVQTATNINSFLAFQKKINERVAS